MATVRHRPGLFLGICLGMVVSVGHAEDRYFTWVDEQGRVHSSVIRESENPVEKRAEAVKARKQAAGEPAGTAEASPSKPVAATQEPPPVPIVDPTAVDDRREAASRPAEPPPGPVAPLADPKVDPTTEPARVADEAAKAVAPEGVSSGQSGESQRAPAVSGNDSEYNLDNYPDGDELAKRGFIREGDPLPYYTWRDASGQVRVDYYRPEPGFEKPARGRPAPRLSAAMVIDGRSPASSRKANPETLAVLGIDWTETLLQSWQEHCCEDLPVKDPVAWDDSREFQVELDDMAPEFGFSTGSSVYRLVRLPSASESGAFVMQVRSYEDHGVFLPTLVFLGRDMQTRRMVTELVYDYSPENWHRHGYLEARVPVFPDHGDRWLLIMSRGDDQAGQTVLEADGAPQVIRHTARGLVSLAQLGG
ncbi:hypothetical protein EZI54_02330 [Marinobacter halodurans]|uniref:DUF4124 domain-containing protein n=1 Tax=Marinobacter halodurans TaxID=2528979 RepID=A0ABY1ZQD6_9GAMM|nr:MalM family protein [Marinobacter halodurans]TBW59168.1 hypothetical protein EZI54_02330 [Marinobacter halodurans]